VAEGFEGCGEWVEEGPACAEALAGPGARTTGETFATFATFATAADTVVPVVEVVAAAAAAAATAAGISVVSSDWRAARAVGSVTPDPRDLSTCPELKNIS
jgi:hypothetical protein